MENSVIKTNRKKNNFSFETSMFSKLKTALKERISLGFSILVIIYICIGCLQAARIFSVYIRAILGIFEIGLSICISYRMGYLGMILCVTMNSMAAASMLKLSNDVAILIEQETKVSAEKLNLITQNTAGLLFSISATRVALIIACIIVSYISENGKKNIERLEFIANIDGVTGLFNHRYFQTRLDEEIVKAYDANSSLGMIMIDLDNFKKYNDIYGHKSGDLLLAKTSQVFMDETREQDIVCRYGGDEFAILLPDSDSESTLLVIERIRNAFEKMTDFDEFCSLPDKVTLSAGYSIYPDLAKNKDDLIEQADTALYQAKNMGRNNVQLYKDIFEDIKFFFDSDEQLFGGLKVLLGTVSAKDKYTLGHSERVMDYAVMIGREMGFSSEKIRLLKIAALLHDIGKVEIPESVLNKSEPLNADDLNLLHKHPSYSVDILEPLSSIELLIDSIKHHHERFDGNGYPCGLKGNDIPLEARILCVADSFDAMLSDRPYRRGMKIDEVIEELEKNSGTQFDPYTVQAFISTLSSNLPLSYR
ncbi:bifunctional diguanylate cyclase/phosphohydrolase [Acetivibrio cellulolyticus]|uniref:bifunctional diguanylate cyclase/phosphohydrolase n=1 Tax=Acetivibrio cellulolyticus TaxID=35830 RepID=UPI0001E2F0D0|nr:diguanylate cyclase [Acetivibrio cellulolyticus]